MDNHTELFIYHFPAFQKKLLILQITMKLLKQIILLSGVWLFFSCPIYAQNTVLQNEQKQVLTLPAIVEMPEIPEEIKDINERYVYFTRHFWDKFNFKQKSVGQIQLDDAFGQYCVGLRLIPAKVAYSEVDALLKKLNKNPTLLYQFVSRRKIIYMIRIALRC